MTDDVKIRIIEGGPLRVTGAGLRRLGIEYDEHQRPVAWQDRGDVEAAEAYSLCRCGASANKPFCDGTHRETDWSAAETADRGPSAERRRQYRGQDVVMTDDKGLCVHAGFCVRESAKAWDLVYSAETPEDHEMLAHMVRSCPSGRLEYALPPDETPVEEELPQQIGVMDDGPLYVQGGIPVESGDGETYEVRNRLTLCRCGASANKPFCDGAHADAGFRDS